MTLGTFPSTVATSSLVMAEPPNVHLERAPRYGDSIDSPPPSGLSPLPPFLHGAPMYLWHPCGIGHFGVIMRRLKEDRGNDHMHALPL
jgi:hypothetical protein